MLPTNVMSFMKKVCTVTRDYSVICCFCFSFRENIIFIFLQWKKHTNLNGFL